MIVADTNKSSIRGIEKAQFLPCGYVRRTRFAKYKLINEE